MKNKIIILAILIFGILNINSVNAGGGGESKYGICDKNVLGGSYAGSGYWVDYYKNMTKNYDKNFQKRIENILKDLYSNFDKKNISIKNQIVVTEELKAKLNKLGNKYGVFVKGDLKETDKNYKIYLIVNYVLEILNTNLERLNGEYCLNNLGKENFLIIAKGQSYADRFISKDGYTYLVPRGTKIETDGPITILTPKNKVNGIIKSELLEKGNGNINFSKESIEQYEEYENKNYKKEVFLTQKINSEEDLDKFIKFYFNNENACSSKDIKSELYGSELISIKAVPCSKDYRNEMGKNEIFISGFYNINYNPKTKIITVTNEGNGTPVVKVSKFKFLDGNKANNLQDYDGISFVNKYYEKLRYKHFDELYKNTAFVNSYSLSEFKSWYVDLETIQVKNITEIGDNKYRITVDMFERIKNKNYISDGNTYTNMYMYGETSKDYFSNIKLLRRVTVDKEIVIENGIKKLKQIANTKKESFFPRFKQGNIEQISRELYKKELSTNDTFIFGAGKQEQVYNISFGNYGIKQWNGLFPIEFFEIIGGRNIDNSVFLTNSGDNEKLLVELFKNTPDDIFENMFYYK